MNVALEIVVLLLLIAVNAVLAGSEIALVSARRARLRSLAHAGDAGARRALALVKKPNRFLSTVQIGITAVAVVAGAFGGTQVAASLTPMLAAAGVPAAAAPTAALALVVVLITYFTLVLGELVPKRYALHDPEALAARVAGPMHRMSVVATPLVRLLGASTDLVLRLLPVRSRVAVETTEEEIRGMISYAVATGELEATEQQIVDRLFRLSDLTVAALMTPADRIVWLDVNAERTSWRDRLGAVHHSRYLVCDGELDRVLGYVSVQELFAHMLDGALPELRALLRVPHIVPEWTPAFRILQRFQWSGDHIAVVTHDDGRVAGVLTLNDVLEGMVGDIPQPHEVERPGVIRRDDGSFLVDGLLPYSDFAAAFGLEPAGAADPPTVHALAVRELDGAVRPTARFEWQHHTVEIVDMDRTRVDKVLVVRTDRDG
jgi:putative hemolysin